MSDLRDTEINALLAQGEMLAQLVAHPGWASYLTLLHDMRQEALEMLATAEPEAVGYLQGVASTLDKIANHPDRIIATAAALQRAEEVDKKIIRTELRSLVGLGVDREGDI